MESTVTPAPLVKLREQFDQHRGAGKRAVFPDELKQQTLALLDDYSPGTILQALRLSPTSLSRWKTQNSTPYSDTINNDKSAVNRDKNTFISLPAVESTASDKYPLTVVLGCTNNPEQVTLQSDVTLSQWHAIVMSVTQALLP